MAQLGVLLLCMVITCPPPDPTVPLGCPAPACKPPARMRAGPGGVRGQERDAAAGPLVVRARGAAGAALAPPRAPPGKPRLAAADSPAARTKRSRLPVAPACSLSPGLHPAPARLAHVSLPLALHTPRSTRVPLPPAPDAPRWAAMAPFGAERGARQATATATASASVAAAPTAVSGTPISGANTTVSGAPAGTAAAAASATATPAAPLLVCRPAYLQLTVYPGARRPAGPVLPCCRSARRRRP